MKNTLFLDFDNTIFNSTKAFCTIYNRLYKYHPNFTYADWTKVDRYDFRDECSLLQDSIEVENIFKMSTLFDNLEFINDNTYEILEQLNEEYQIIICSIGTYENISLKSIFIKEKLPFIKDSVFIINQGCKMSKEIVNMNVTPSIFIDDVASNLDSSNAKLKICFGDFHDWNRGYEGYHCYNWTGIKNYLDSIIID